MRLKGNCRTTAMGIMPHTDVNRALDLALSLDVPFWPQLPNVSFFEDMYVQASQNFPGITIDTANEKVLFNTARFADELVPYADICDRDDTFALTPEYSAVYQSFLAKDLANRATLRGQIIGPVSFGFRVVDENLRPIIYDDEIRALLFDFLQKKANLQYRELTAKNPNALVWLDEPGLGWVFSAMSGYTDVAAKIDYASFLAGLEGPKALHLCANINLPFLLELGLDVLSFDAYQIGALPQHYIQAIGDYLKEGGLLSWGVVPTDSQSLQGESPESLAAQLQRTWEKVARIMGSEPAQVAAQAWIAPARCCLKNAGKVGSTDDVKGTKSACATSDEESIVETAFDYIRQISAILRETYNLPD